MFQPIIHLIALIFLTTATIKAENVSAQSDAEDPLDLEIVSFILVTENERFNLSPETLSNVKPNISTVFLIHGWYTSSNVDTSLLNITRALSLLNDRNVIYVDWSSLAQNSYRNLVYYGNSRIGNEVGEMIMLLYDQLALDVKSVQIIGVTLGAHIAGYAGRYVKSNHPEGASLGRITALEASGHLFSPIFGVFTNPRSLRSSDADVVDVTHTNTLYFGSTQNIGTVDFYVNGGQTQAFCGKVSIADYFGWSALNICSHAFAVLFYQLTINNVDYKASTDTEICENVIVYGDKLSINISDTGSIYYVNTEDHWPFKTLC